MRAATHSIAQQSIEYDRSFEASFSAARKIRDQHVKVRPHRAITPLKLTPYLLAQTILLPLAMCGLLVWAKPLLLDFWRACLVFWSQGLALPFTVSTQLDLAGHYAVRLKGTLGDAPMPTTFIMQIATVLTLVLLVVGLRMKNSRLPLRYPLLIIACVQGLSLMFFALSSTPFPYSIEQHCEELMTIGYIVMLATPFMLAMGYYILNQRLVIKVAHTLLILLFFTIMVPHQVLAQALIMQHFSVLFMPVLYICFSAVLDALVFVALYSWAVSNVPANATQ